MTTEIISPSYKFESQKRQGCVDRPEKSLTFDNTIKTIVDKSIRLKVCKLKFYRNPTEPENY